MHAPKKMAKKQRRFWTTAEVSTLISLYPDTPMADLVGKLERPSPAIYAKAKELRVKRSADFLAGEHSGRVRTGNQRGIETRFKKTAYPR